MRGPSQATRTETSPRPWPTREHNTPVQHPPPPTPPALTPHPTPPHLVPLFPTLPSHPVSGPVCLHRYSIFILVFVPRYTDGASEFRSPYHRRHHHHPPAVCCEGFLPSFAAVSTASRYWNFKGAVSSNGTEILRHATETLQVLSLPTADRFSVRFFQL